MQLNGSRQIAAPRDKVWAALNDPDVLARAIPGCQSLTAEGDGFAAVVEVKIGPIGARFNGRVAIEDPVPPTGYRLVGEGRGGMAGNARGAAQVTLEDKAGGTLLSYTVDAEVGGRLAQLGGAVIDATAARLADQFFARFEREVTGQGQAQVSSAAPAAVGQVAAPVVAGGTPWGWIAVLALAIVAGFLIGRSDAADWMPGAVALLVVLVAVLAYRTGRGSAR